MKKRLFLFGGALAPALAFAVAPAGNESASVVEAISTGEAHLEFRLRYEAVEIDAPVNDDNEALTLRTRLNFATASWQGLSAFLEVDDISAWDDDYNDTINGEPGPAIADPETTEVNQAFLNYKRWDSDFRAGRQRIILDNSRFVGNVGWRQNEQTYDALAITSNAVAPLRLSYAYLSRVHRVFGEDSAVGDANLDSHIFNVGWKLGDLGDLVGYAYLLESDDAFAGFADWSSDTFGLRFSGQIEGDVSWHYVLEYATQSEAGDNPKDYTADYLHAEGGAGFSGIDVTLGFESLGADGDDGFFVTPLATLHKFQGWADVFLNKGKGNISEGILDTYLSVSASVAGIKLAAVYHEYESDEDNGAGDDDLGDEIGLVASRDFGPVSLQLKYADYSAGANTAFNGGSMTLTDTEKLWLTASAKF